MFPFPPVIVFDPYRHIGSKIIFMGAVGSIGVSVIIAKSHSGKNFAPLLIFFVGRGIDGTFFIIDGMGDTSAVSVINGGDSVIIPERGIIGDVPVIGINIDPQFCLRYFFQDIGSYFPEKAVEKVGCGKFAIDRAVFSAIITLAPAFDHIGTGEHASFAEYRACICI